MILRPLDLSDAKLDAAKTFGATHAVNPAVDDEKEAVKGLTGGRGADYVFVTVGSVKAIEQGLDPSVMAERVVNGIRDEQLYILSEEGGVWREICNARLDDLRLARNPTGPALAIGN